MHSRIHFLGVVFAVVAFGQQPHDAYQSATTGDLGAADSFVNFTNTSASGQICVNIYAQDTRSPEQLYSCCSGLVASSQLYSLSARSIIPNVNTLDRPPSSFVIKLVASTGSCNPASVSAANLTSGMQASIGPAPGSAGVSFQPAQFKDGELESLASSCGFIQANGSGFGICRSPQLVVTDKSDDQKSFLFWFLFFV